MRKSLFALLVSLVMLMSMTSVMAETAAPSAAVPSITMGELVNMSGETTQTEDSTEGLIVYLANFETTAEEQKVLDEIAAHVEEKPVAEFFGEETMTAAAAVLPEETDVSALHMDEFFALKVDGYKDEHGDVETVFAFYTEYPAEAKLVGMVGILAEDGTVTWIPVAAEVVDGKVKVVLTQEVMQLVLENDAVFALLSDHEVVVVDEAVEATGK